MITSFKLFENKYKNISHRRRKFTNDLIIVNVINDDEDYLKAVNHFSSLFPRVFQLINKPKYIFTKETNQFKIEFKDLNIVNVPVLFYPYEVKSILDKIKHVPDDFEYFITKEFEVYIYLGVMYDNKWLFLNKDFYSYLIDVHHTTNKITLIGEKDLTSLYKKVIELFDITVELENKLLYN